MRARRMQTLITAAVAVLVLGACGSSGGDGGAGSGDGNGDSPTTTAVSPAHVGANEQSGGTEATGTNGIGAGGSVLTDAQREGALCERSGTDGADEGNNSSGSGDAKNYAAVAKGIGDAIDERCEERSQP